METKTLRGVEIKDEARGEVAAVFATFNAVDAHRDVTRPGAMEDGAKVRISAYNHESWMGALPVGKGVIRTTDREAVLEGQFFMNTTAGRDTFEVVKELSEDRLQEWSYGYDPVEYAFGEFDEQPVRFLDAVNVHEVSPVLLGAGVGTRTLSVKSATCGCGGPTLGAALRGAAPGFARVDDAALARAAGVDPAALGVSVCTCVTARAPDAANSAVGGREVEPSAGDGAAVDGAGPEPDGPEPDGAGADPAPPSSPAPGSETAPESGAVKFAEEGESVLAAVASFRSRAADVLAMRREKGKGFGAASAALLEQVHEETKCLGDLLAPEPATAEEKPAEAGAQPPADGTSELVRREVLRFMALDT